MSRVIVIGGGAAGMMAAVFAARSGRKSRSAGIFICSQMQKKAVSAK